MDSSIENRIKLKALLKNFYKNNRFKINTLIVILIILFISFVLFKIYENKKNNLVAEKYIRAGIYLASDKKDEAKIIYEEIILNKNKIYAVLSLNTIIEKELISDKKIIIKYFEILEKSKLSKENQDLITLKKALYLIKSSEEIEGNNLLKKLIEKNSTLKSIAEELVEN